MFVGLSKYIGGGFSVGVGTRVGGGKKKPTNFFGMIKALILIFVVMVIIGVLNIDKTDKKENIKEDPKSMEASNGKITK